ncbi:hypothetical protein DHW03_05500 [Pedobacter yonginense]|uniref:Uncharacterized protein n=1 Tax=Pedobacter yonginense TaxID=651869 RepID=A0A317ETP7_9SPHI|nr:hypothetical protein [Pedobacter yonginense]PWS29273.1 hypothetical protein DHW03_05500 [Pedobacter yonginense]
MLSKEQHAQAKSFLSELNNARYEYSFSSEDSWSITECTSAQKATIEKEFYPVLFVQSGFESLPAFSNLVSSLLNKTPESDLVQSNPSKERIFLVAYCLNKKA